MSELINKIHQDEQLYISLLAKKGKDYRLDIPVVSELYNHLRDSVFKLGINSLNEVPYLNSSDLKDGVFQTKDNKLVVIIDIPKGTLKYHTFFATKQFRESKVADLVDGKYLISFCYDTTKMMHLIPEGFTYLVLDISESDVIPFHAIENSLPSDLSVYWVYFALRKLQSDFFNKLDISKSLDEKEKTVLMEKGYL